MGPVLFDAPDKAVGFIMGHMEQLLRTRPEHDETHIQKGYAQAVNNTNNYPLASMLEQRERLPMIKIERDARWHLDSFLSS